MLHLPGLSRPPKASQKAIEKADEKGFAGDLIGHSFWSGIAFIAILAIAGGIELFARALITLRVFDADSYLAGVAHLAAGILATLDMVFLIAVVVKKAWAYLKEV